MTLRVPQINDIKPFTIRGVSARARPFVNLASEGDSVSLIPEGDQDFFDAGDSWSVTEMMSESEIEKSLSEEELLRIREEADKFWN
jgi:hypothetical protein